MKPREHLKIICSLIKEAKEAKKEQTMTENWMRRQQSIERLMDKVLELYLAIKNNSSLILNSQPEFKSYLKESGYNLRGLSSELYRYISATEDIFNLIFDGGEWEKACWRRSAIEAVKEMYKGTSFEEFYDELDTEDLDDIMENRCSKEGVEKDRIPKGIPTSHWWWSPQLPPANRE